MGPERTRNTDSSPVPSDLCADSSDNLGKLDTEAARARARGHGGGFMSSLQSKWDTMWGSKADDKDLPPEEWQNMHDSHMGQGQIDDSEELVGDRYGVDDDGNEEARMWGMHDEHRTGNIYTPGAPTGRERLPPKIIDRGSISETGNALRTAAQNADSSRQVRLHSPHRMHLLDVLLFSLLLVLRACVLV